jgi:hypothetical protein
MRLLLNTVLGLCVVTESFIHVSNVAGGRGNVTEEYINLETGEW